MRDALPIWTIFGAAKLPNWEHEESVLTNGEYATYWSLLWQLQVAAKLRAVGRNVAWTGPDGGPDLSVDVDGKPWHVECYVPRKSYFLLQFLQESLSKILGLSVQDDCDASRREETSAKYVTIVYEDHCSVAVVEEEWDTNKSDDAVDRRRRLLERWRWDSPEQHITAMLKGALSSKGQSNRLGDHHPNVLAVNLLLTNAEAAEYHDRDGNMIAGCAPELPATLDVLAVANCGIDASVPNLRIAACGSPNWCRKGRWLEAEPDDGLETG